MASSESGGTDPRTDSRLEPRTELVGACPLCGEEGAEMLWTLPDRLYGVPGEYRYVRCSGCRSVYQSPRVVEEDLPLCYPGSYYTHSGDGGGSDETADAVERSPSDGNGRDGAGDAPSVATRTGNGPPSTKDRVRSWIRWAVQGGGEQPGATGRVMGRLLALSRSLRERAFFGLIDEVIPRTPEPGRALEIGSGSGWELSLLNRMGWDAEGVEFDPAAAERASREHGVAVRVGEFTEVIDPEERFQLIYLSHVFEHLTEPGEALSFFRRHLARSGRAVLVFPNPHGHGARLWDRHWLAWDPPRHLVLPSIDGLRALAAGAGLRARIHTRARGAGHVHAASRTIARIARGSPAENPLSPRVRVRDRLLALGERALVSVGFPLGEETVVVLRVAE